MNGLILDAVTAGAPAIGIEEIHESCAKKKPARKRSGCHTITPLTSRWDFVNSLWASFMQRRIVWLESTH
jgi:hypothetical protein